MTPKYALIAALALGTANACTIVHGGPQDGTETGNPPVIDVARVMLVVDGSIATITGGPGAILPGGGDLEVQSSLTGKIYQTLVADDGSFSIEILGSRQDIYELRAADASGDTGKATPVYLTQGTVPVVAGPQGLSCIQRESLARAEISNLVDNITTSFGQNYCKMETDCRLVEIGTLCTDACAPVAVSNSGGSQIEELRAAIASNICRDFAADGCNVTALPCEPPEPSVLRCIDSMCMLAPITPKETGCSEDFDQGDGDALISRYWYSSQAETCLARTYGGLGGNANRYETRSACEAACKPAKPSCQAPRVSATVCIEASGGGSCSRMGTACALPCTGSDQCSADPIGSVCAGSFCDATRPN